MLNGIRKATQHGMGRAVMTFLLGMLIIAFAVWGVGDMFRGFVSDKVATVGKAVITARDFQTEFQNLVYQYQRVYKTALTNAQARAQGFDSQILEKLIDEAALDQRAQALGLSLSDAAIAEAARTDPKLQDANGQFNRALFDQALRDSGLSEAGFFAKQRQTYLRQQLAQSLVNGVTTPTPVLAALVAAELQARDADYFVLTDSAAGDIPAPADDVLKTFFEERKANFRAPEYRGVDILLANPSTLAKPGEVGDEDARAVYEKTKVERFTTAEKRNVQQMVFGSEGEAADALRKIRGGESFEDLAKERNLTATDTDLGLVAKADIFDPAIGDAAFALAQGAVSDVVKGKFGFLLLRATEIVPGSVKPFDDVRDEVKTAIATTRANNDIQTIHDKIEDQRVAGKSLADAAKSAGLEVRSIAAVDATGHDPKGAVVDLPEAKSLLAAVFASDVGVDDAALNTHERGFLWFDVAHVDPAHDRTFDEVKPDIEKLWRAQETSKTLNARAADFVKQIDGGAALADVARSLSLEVKSAANIRRNDASTLPQAVAVAVFGKPADKAGFAATPLGTYVFKITKDVTPPFDIATPGVKSLGDKFSQSLQNSVIDQFVGALKKTLGVKINQQTLQMAEGG